MKKLIFSVLALSIVGLANPAFAAGGNARKGAYNKAKQDCLKDKPDLKGKDLQKCIHEKKGK